MRFSLGLLSLSAAMALTSAATAAPSKTQCVDANTEAQSMRTSGKLRAARELLRLCADPACPGIVREDCTTRLDEIEKHQPTITFIAKDARGADVVDVRVIVDGVQAAGTLDGRAMPVDPGPHTFVFETDGAAPVEKTYVIREGERARVESIVFAAKAAPRDEPDVQRFTAAAAPKAPKGPVGRGRTVGLVLGGAGVLGLSVGSVLGLMASTRWSRAESACPSEADCDVTSASRDKASAEDLSTGSTVSFVVGGALLVGGAVMFALGRSQKTLAIAPAPSREGASLFLRSAF